MGQTFYNILSSEVFWVIMGIWVVICIGWKSQWQAVLERLGKLITKPSIFKTDPKPDNVPFYPREAFEEITSAIQKTLKKPFSDFLETFSGWIRSQVRHVYDLNHVVRTIGYVLFLAAFLWFVLADAIAVANTLAVLHLLSTELPPLLGRFDLAVFGGSLGALIIGMVLVFEIQADDSTLSKWSERDDKVRGLGRGIAFLVTLLAFITLITWALARLVALQKITSTPFTDGVINWVLFGLVPINSALAAAISFLEAVMGVLVVIFILECIFYVAIYLANFLATILGTLIPFLLFDLIFKLIYVIMDILQWFVKTPVLAVLTPFVKIFDMISGNH